MADDLVKRLNDAYGFLHDPLLKEAADRIEQLEAALQDMKVVEWEAQHYRKRVRELAAALRKIIAMTPDPEFGAVPIDSAIEVARKALGVKGDYASDFARAALEGKDAS